MLRSFPNVRFSILCFAAVAVALPMAIISIAKLLLFLCALGVLVDGWLSQRRAPALLLASASPVILLTLVLMAVSGLWSTGTTDEALLAIVKHGKLALIPIVLSLTRSRREALVAVAFFVGGQVFSLSSTWLMFMGIAVPWATSKEMGICEICSFAVFSSYLDQSIMTAVLAAVCWHLRCYAGTRWRTPLALTTAGLALVCVFFIFQGRTGHLVAIALMTLAIVWEFPTRYRFQLVLIPLLLTAVLAASSGKVSHGLTEIGNSIESFNQSGPTSSSSSSSIRIDLWHRSLQSLAASPWHGTGVGSWEREFKRQETIHAQVPAPSSANVQHHNPHQEYLLWGVELGVPGIALLCAVLLALYRDSLRLETPARRAMQSVLLALTIACLFNCTLYDSLIGDFFCIALALLLALGSHTAPLAAATSPNPGV